MKIAAAEAKRAFNVSGNVAIIDVGHFNTDINGQVMVVEFESCKNRGVVAVKSPGKL
jgi:hypothetical protein